MSAAIFDRENPRLKEHENFPEGGDSSTFQWNPPNVLWAEAVMLAMEKGKYVERGREMAKILEVGIDRVIAASLPDGIPQVGPHYKREGLGLHQGIKFWKRLRDGNDVPDPEMRDVVVNRLLDCGIVTLGAGNRGINPAIRFMPSLVVTEKEIGEFLHALESALLHTRHSTK